MSGLPSSATVFEHPGKNIFSFATAAKHRKHIENMFGANLVNTRTWQFDPDYVASFASRSPPFEFVAAEQCCTLAGIELPAFRVDALHMQMPPLPVQRAPMAGASGGQAGDQIGHDGESSSPGSDSSGRSSDEGSGSSEAARADPRAVRGPQKWPAQVLFAALRIASKLRDMSDLPSVVLDAVRLTSSSTEAAEISSRIDRGELVIPGRNTLSRSRQKLDILAMLWERRLKEDFFMIRYMAADSSPQMGVNYFAIREDTLLIPRPSVSSGSDDGDLRLAFARMTREDAQKHFRTFLWPLTSLGAGAASLSHKLRNFMHAVMLHTGSSDDYRDYRYSVYGGSSDQSTESKLWNSAFYAEPTFERLMNIASDLRAGHIAADSDAVTDRYLHPRALFLPEHIHILSNALETAVKLVPEWKRFESSMKAIANLLNKVAYRERFIECCLKDADAPTRALFDGFSRRPLDWRWEYLALFLSRVCPVLPHLSRYFDVRKIVRGAGDDEPEWDTSVLDGVKEALAWDVFPALAEMFRIVSKAVKREIDWLELCPCHPPKPTSRGRAGGGVLPSGEPCVWRGRRSYELANGYVDQMLANIRTATSDRLTELVLTLEPARQVVVLHGLDVARHSLQEELQEKLLPIWKTLPCSLLGMFDPDVEASRRAARQSRAEWAATVRKDRVHRVAREFFQGPAGQELDAFCDTDVPLTRLSNLWFLTFVYSMCSAVGRRIEGDHAQVKHTGRLLTSHPPSVAAKVRMPYVLSLLKDPVFSEWASSSFYKRGFVRSVLDFKFAKRDRASMSWPRFKHEVYLSSGSQHFTSEAGSAEAQQFWAQSVAHVLTDTVERLGTLHRIALEWLRDRIRPGSVFGCPPSAVRVLQTDGPQCDGHAAWLLDDILLRMSDPDLVHAVGSGFALSALSRDEMVARRWGHCPTPNPKTTGNTVLESITLRWSLKSEFSRIPTTECRCTEIG